MPMRRVRVRVRVGERDPNRVRVRVRVGERDPNDLRIKYSFRVLACIVKALTI